MNKEELITGLRELVAEPKKKKKEEKYQYDIKTLNKFADIIAFEYNNDYDKFCREKGALSKEDAALLYTDPDSYYEKHVQGTEWDEPTDFFRPEVPLAFWQRLYQQSRDIMIAKVEKFYEEKKLESGIDEDPRRKKIEEIGKRLLEAGVILG
jgi:hypothetical protein